MKRKLVKQGAATLMISLPSKWLKQQGLDKGDEVDLIEENENILICSEESNKKNLEKKQINIDLSEDNKENIKIILTHAYRKGFDIINLSNILTQDFKNIKKIVKELMLGFEITEKNNSSCKIENISEPTEQKYNVMIKRIFLILKETLEIIKQDFNENKFKNTKEIEELRDQADKFILFCKRIITKENNKTGFLEWEFLTFLMHIEHSFYYLYNAQKPNYIPEKQIIQLINELESYFDLFSKSYFNKSLDQLNKINSLKSNYHFGECLKVMNKTENPIIVSYLKDCFRWIQLGTSPLFSMFIESKLNNLN